MNNKVKEKIEMGIKPEKQPREKTSVALDKLTIPALDLYLDTDVPF